MNKASIFEDQKGWSVCLEHFLKHSDEETFFLYFG